MIRSLQNISNFPSDLITENPGFPGRLMALYQQLGRNAPVFDYKKDFRYYEMVDSNLAALYPNSEAVIDLNRKVTELRDLLRLEIGSVAPEIALPDSTGKVISTLFIAQTICAPCFLGFLVESECCRSQRICMRSTPNWEERTWNITRCRLTARTNHGLRAMGDKKYQGYSCFRPQILGFSGG